MDHFDHMLNWKLKVGSHQFPSKDGGTCINEAALVAAGYEYRPIQSAEHMPECFSRPICAYALRLNDLSGHAERQQLLRFVTRLACADSPEIERRREGYIAFHSRRCRSFQGKLEVLEGALAIGRQADPLGPDEIRTRMDQAKGRAIPMQSRPKTAPSAKLRSWLAAMM